LVSKLVDNGLFEVQLNHTKEEIHLTNIDVWHECLGHLSENEMKKLLKCNILAGLDFKIDDHLSFCPVCSVAIYSNFRYKD